jgi:hypothetical protein
MDPVSSLTTNKELTTNYHIMKINKTIKTILPLAAAMGSLALAATSANAATLISHFSFDTDFTDQGPGSNDGTALNGAAITTTVGESKFGGGGLKLDGTNDYVDFGDIALGAFSVSAWIKPDVLGSLDGIILGDAANKNWIRVETGSSTNAVVKNNDNDAATISLTASPEFTNGEWQHVVVTRDGTTGNVTFYRNNVLVASGAGNTDTFTPEFIGHKLSGTAANYYDGVMDEVRIYSDVLTTSEIEGLFTSNAVPEPSSTALLGLGGLALILRRRK